MSHKYSKIIDQIEGMSDKAFNRYWRNVSKKMARKYFWECKVLKRDCFKMTFPYSLGEHDRCTLKFYDTDIIKDYEILIDHYARRNGLEICAEKLLGNKTVYWFKKANLG